MHRAYNSDIPPLKKAHIKTTPVGTVPTGVVFGMCTPCRNPAWSFSNWSTTPCLVDQFYIINIHFNALI